MSRDLIEQFFDRDLSAQEWEQVKAAIADDPEASSRLAALAEKEWKNAGLSDNKPSLSHQPWVLVLGALGVLSLAVFMAIFAMRGLPAKVVALPTVPQVDGFEQSVNAQLPSAKSPVKNKPQACRLEAKAIPGNEPLFEIKASVPAETEFVLTVSSKKQSWVLHQGALGQAETFQWKAPASGQYRLTLQAGKERVERWLWAGSRP
jgi:hypothetical protein